jgi:phage terminase large subunit GpA-like protein
MLFPNAYTISAEQLPPGLLAALDPDKPLEVSFSWTKAERKLCRKRKNITVSEWAAKNRVLNQKESNRPGPWRNEETPWLVGLMDAMAFSSVREVVICKSPQFGGSEAINNFLGSRIDLDPANILLTYPDLNDTKKNIKRVQSMIDNSSVLSEYLTGKKDDESSYLINLQHITIRAGWPRSTQSLASTQERYIVLEEVDKPGYETGSREANPIDLAKKRATTHQGREKIILNSSPSVEAGNIWQALLSCQVIFEHWARCPKCLEYQPMFFGRKDKDGNLLPGGFRWPKKEEIAPNKTQLEYIEMIVNDQLARYECAKCGHKWDDYTRNRAVALGQWRQRTDDGRGLELFNYLNRYRPKKIGFHGPAWISKFILLSRSVAAFLRGQKESGLLDWKAKLRNFMNGHKAEPWLEYFQERPEEKILALQDERPEGRVPGNNVVAGLVFGIDTQDNGFYVEIRAFGYGLARDSWGVRAAFVDSFDGVKRMLWQDVYKDAAGNTYPVLFGLIDAMGHRTDEVYAFCKEHPGLILPAKGDRVKAQPFTYGNLEYYPGSKKAIPDGLQIVNVNTKHYKDLLNNKLDIKPGDPGAWHLHAETPAEYAGHFVAETTDEHGFWINPQKKPNHYWDTANLCLVAADILGIKFWPKPEDQAQDPDDYETSRSDYVNG